MSTHPTTDRRTLHLLLAATSLQVVLLSVNRLGTLTLGFVAPNEFLRWTDLNNMALGFLAVLVTFLLVRQIRQASTTPVSRAHRWLDVAFVVGAYLYASGYGNHEVTNYLNGRFCVREASDLCRIVAFNDAEFSHFLFFAGFTTLTVVVALTNFHSPDHRRLTVADNVSAVVNGLFVSAGIVANLAFESIGLDLYVVGAVVVFVLFLLLLRPCQLVVRYYAVAYTAGFAVAIVLKVVAV